MTSGPSIYERPLTARFLFVQAAGTFRARLWRILAVALGIGLIASLVDVAFDAYLDHVEGEISAGFAAFLVGAVAFVTGANTFGGTVLAGVLDKTVGEHQHGHRAMKLREVLLVLPYLSLIGADIVVSVMRAAGWLLLVVPGAVALTLTCIVGPVIVIEKRRAFSAIGRSIRLTRPVFWLAFRAVTVLFIGEAFLSGALESLPLAHGPVGHLAIALLVEVPLASFVALVEITLAYHLIERDRPGSISATHD